MCFIKFIQRPDSRMDSTVVCKTLEHALIFAINFAINFCNYFYNYFVFATLILERGNYRRKYIEKENK